MIVRSDQSRVGALEDMVLSSRQASYVLVLGLEDQVLDTVLEAPVLSLDSCIIDCVPGATFSKLRKILGRFLILGQFLTISGKTLTVHNVALITNSRFNSKAMQ